MSAQPGPFLPERETQFLRASVVEAAMTLGPKVTKLMFADSIYKHRREQGSSSGSSFDGVPFLDEYYSTTGSDSSSNIDGIPEELEENFNENFDSKTVLINDDFGSHFVLIPKNKKPLQSIPEDIPSEQLNSKPPKKGGRNFTFLSRKSVKKVESAQTKKQPSISPPRRLFPALDDPVAPTFINPPTNKARSDISNSPRATPIKLRKRINFQVPSDDDDWDFKDPDRPSFFFDQVPELLKDGGGKKSQNADVDIDDRGYLSEGAGLSHKHTSFRRKKKSTNPYIDWGEKLVSGNRNGSKSNLRQNAPVPFVPMPVSLPVADRFIRKLPPSQTQTGKKESPSETDAISLDNKLIVLPAKPPHQLTATPISDLSFIMMPDLNVAKRLHLERYISDETSGVIGADNVVKLQMMEKLLKQKDIRVLKEKPLPGPHPLSKPPAVVDQSVPEIEITSPSTTLIEPINDDIAPIRGKDAPFPSRQGARSPGPIPIVRGREPAFPTKPIRRNNASPHSSVSPLRLKPPPPDRYKDIDVPRSVRSSYEKDLAREEEGTESLPVRGRWAGNSSIGTPSVYSQR